MTTRRPLWALVACLAFWPFSSYCEPFTYGTTGNAAVNGFTWSMGTLVPSSPGLSINGVIYRYTTVKDQDAAMLVHLQNEDADGDEYAQDEETRELLAYDSTPARFLARRRGLFAEERGAIVHGVRGCSATFSAFSGDRYELNNPTR